MKMLTRMLGAATCASVLWSVAPAANAQLIYDEAVDGDLEWFDRLDLGIGMNRISGSSQVGSIVDQDSFDFNVPEGAFLVSAVFSYFDVDAYNLTRNLNAFGTGYGLRSLEVDIPTNYFTVYSRWNSTTPLPHPHLPSPVVLFNAELPLGAGRYSLFNGPWWISNIPSPGGNWDYTLTLMVSSVPEVPAAAYLALGLCGVAGRAARRMKQAEAR